MTKESRGRKRAWQKKQAESSPPIAEAREGVAELMGTLKSVLSSNVQELGLALREILLELAAEHPKLSEKEFGDFIDQSFANLGAQAIEAAIVSAFASMPIHINLDTVIKVGLERGNLKVKELQSLSEEEVKERLAHIKEQKSSCECPYCVAERNRSNFGPAAAREIIYDA